MTLSAKASGQNLSFGRCLVADCVQNLPLKVKPCSAPLVKIAGLCGYLTKYIGIEYSLKSVNDEDICRGFQGPFVCRSDPESKQTFTQTNDFHSFSSCFSWTYGLNTRGGGVLDPSLGIGVPPRV